MPIPEVGEKRRIAHRITKIITDAVGSIADQRIRNFLNAAKH